jgi:hypothetical protein
MKADANKRCHEDPRAFGKQALRPWKRTRAERGDWQIVCHGQGRLAGYQYYGRHVRLI